MDIRYAAGFFDGEGSITISKNRVAGRSDYHKIIGFLADGNVPTNNRKTPYGEQFVQSLYVTKHALAEEGSYWVATNPTPGTALAGAVQATFSDTVAAFVIQNTNPAGSGLNVVPDYLGLIVTVAPASGTSLQYLLKLEPGSLRAPTAGNAALTLASPNGNSPLPAGIAIQSFTGAAFLTVPASTGQVRVVGRGVLRGVIPAVGDYLGLAFGSSDPGASSGGDSANGTRQVSSTAPIIIPPQGSLTVHLWSPSNAVTGISAECELGGWVR